MYDPQDLLRRIDQNAGWILMAFAFAMVFQTVWLVECFRLARRQRVYTMPLFCTFFWFAHDTGYVARFHEWFFVYDHWFLKCFWVGLLSAVVLELLFFSQVVKYGRQEIASGISTRAFIIGLVLVQVGSSATWELFKYLANDPLYQFAPLLTQIAYPLFGLAMLLRRRSALGQNVTMWVAFTGMTIVWNITTAVWYGPAFRALPYLLGGAVAVVGGLLMIYAIKVAPRAEQTAENALSRNG
ncbi:MAG TPA: hypothetical protein VGH89_21605 [Pseudonocardia sp.]|jgi:hypothetical protein